MAESIIRGEICVVGAGPVGITLALELARAGRDVILLESGGLHESPAGRDLNRGLADPPGCHEPLEENRRRQLGGATSVWGGRCVPFDPIDFVVRDWVPHSGWPISYDDIAPFYGQALAICRAGRADFSAAQALSGVPAETMDDFDDDQMVSDGLERWSPPVRFGSRFGGALSHDPHVRQLLNTTCTHLQLTPEGGAVDHVDAVREDGTSLRIAARHVVLTAGGLESTRLLLASRDVVPQGIGNLHDQLGRYYMTHLSGTVAQLESERPPRGAFERDGDAVYCRRRFGFTPMAQKRHELLNTVFFFSRPSGNAAGHRDALFSAVFLAKLARESALAPRHAPVVVARERDAIVAHAKVVMRDFPSLVHRAPVLIRRRLLASRRLPMILPDMNAALLPLEFQAEHAPNPASRVELCPERDASGVPRLVVAPAFSDLDTRSVVEAHHLMAARTRESGNGELHLDEGALSQALLHITTRVNSAAHQLGTTRMSATPRTGVVDRDCLVHGVANLSVVGSSVFPTSSHANPTLMVLALALRHAQYLSHR